jgi:hypothetical protein
LIPASKPPDSHPAIPADKLHLKGASVKKLLFAVLAVALAVTTLSTPGSALVQTPDSQAKQDNRINGKWHFVFDTQGGDREFEAEFSVDADGKVTGTWDNKPATGTYKDGHLKMAFDTFSQEANETAQLQLDGQIDDSTTLTGNWAFSSYDGTFKATHPKP